jgi:cation transport ATPase
VAVPEKPVVHVTVAENQSVTPERPQTRVATYKISGLPEQKFYFDPKSLRYTEELRADVKAKLRSVGHNEKKTNRTVVKVWRDNATRASPKAEKGILRALNAALCLEIILAILIIIGGSLISQDKVEELFPGAALAAVTANAAFFLGHFAVRSSAMGDPFEYTGKQQLFTYTAILGAMLLNIAVFFELPAALIPETLMELKDNVQRYFAIAGLVGTVIGAGFSGAFDAAKWILGEEVQRRSSTARGVMDELERRERV